MRLARSRFNNRAALLGTPIGTKVALRSAATMPTMSERACMQKIADSLEHAPEGVRWEVATDLAFCLIGRSCEESVQSLAAWYGSLLRRGADYAKVSKKALMSERACIQKIADSVAHAPVDVRWEVALDLACCLIGRSCEESVQSLAAWYGSLRRRFPSAVIEFVSSVSALDLDQSFHLHMVLEVLMDSKEQVRSAVALGDQRRRRERQAACCPWALGAVHAQQPETQEATTQSEGIEEHIRWQNELAHEIKRNTRRMAMQPCGRPTLAPCPEEVAEVCQKGISKKARRRQAKKAEQRRLQELRQQRFKQKGDEEFVKIAKNVEQFKQEEETTVKMDLECLTEELDAKLRDLEWEKRRQECGVEARSFPTKAQLLRCHIQGGVQRGEQMRREVIAFVQGIAKDMLVPEAASFADALVTKLLAGAPSDFDSVAAWCVYGPLARAFCSRTWKDPLLARTRHGVDVAAAATVS